MQDLMTTDEAAEFLDLHPATMATWRMTEGRGQLLEGRATQCALPPKRARAVAEGPGTHRDTGIEGAPGMRKLLTAAEVAEVLGIQPKTLMNQRTRRESQYDNYADDPNVLEPFGDERDAAVEAAAWRPELLAAALDEPAAAAFPARLLAAATAYQRRGWHLFPTDGADGKHPAVKWGTEATNDLEQILTWFSHDGFTGVGISCGPSSLYVVDMDAYKPQATQSMRWLTENGFLFPRTLSAETPSGGVHYYYQQNSPALRNSNGRLPGIERQLAGFDGRGVGGFVVAPPTRRADGTEYAFLPDRWAAQPVACPDWLRRDAAPAPPPLLGASPAARTIAPLEQIKRAHSAFDALKGHARSVETAEQGTRQTTLFQAASTLGRLVARGYIDRHPVEQRLSAAGRDAGLDDKEIRATLKYHIDREIHRFDNRGPGAPQKEAYAT